MEREYGLELTNNSKTSWAFSLPRDLTCIMATDVCHKLCYGNGIRYQTDAHKAKRLRNYRTVELLLTEGGPELLAENLVFLIDQIRPSDWLASRIRRTRTKTPWTLRVHDVGDFYKVDYVRAWRLAALERPSCMFWFYTRSFRDSGLFDELTKLAILPNCQGWLSIDSQNFYAGLKAYSRNTSVWKLAFLQETDTPDPVLVEELSNVEETRDVVLFPYHRGGYHVKPLAHDRLFTCPAVTGKFKLQTNSAELRPCQACNFCLP